VRARKKLGVSAPDFGALIEVAIAAIDSTNIAEHVPVTLLAQPASRIGELLPHRWQITAVAS
jgi:hypothetical protein